MLHSSHWIRQPCISMDGHVPGTNSGFYFMGRCGFSFKKKLPFQVIQSDLLIPDRWRSRFQPLKRVTEFHRDPKKVTFSRRIPRNVFYLKKTKTQFWLKNTCLQLHLISHSKCHGFVCLLVVFPLSIHSLETLPNPNFESWGSQIPVLFMIFQV